MPFLKIFFISGKKKITMGNSFFNLIKEDAVYRNVVNEEQKSAQKLQDRCIANDTSNKLIYTDGSIYVGDHNYGVRQGRGTYIDANYEYIGEWDNDNRHGNGKVTQRSKKTVVWTYEGEWADDRVHGRGTSMDRGEGTYTG